MGDLSNHITVHNDVDAALLGELVLHKYPESHIFCLTLGTGIGGAFYTQQHGLYTGRVITQMKLATYFTVQAMV